MTAESSAWDRLTMTRDTPSILGPEIPGATSCPGCHRLADVIDLYRKAERISEAEIAALRADNDRLRHRYEKGTS